MDEQHDQLHESHILDDLKGLEVQPTVPHSVVRRGEDYKHCTKLVVLLEGRLYVIDKPDNLVSGGFAFPEACLGSRKLLFDGVVDSLKNNLSSSLYRWKSRVIGR